MIDQETVVKLWDSGVNLETIVKVAGFELTEQALRSSHPVAKDPSPHTRTVVRGDVLRLLNTGSSTVQDLVKVIGAERRTVHRCLEKAEEQGYVVSTGSLWRLTELGREYVAALGAGRFLGHQALTKFNAKHFKPATEQVTQ